MAYHETRDVNRKIQSTGRACHYTDVDRLEDEFPTLALQN